MSENTIYLPVAKGENFKEEAAPICIAIFYEEGV